MKNSSHNPYPVVDLFAGPGGLGEGFSSYSLNNVPKFKSVISIEQDSFAHKTLLLRHFFRSFEADKVPEKYYSYVAGHSDLKELKELYPVQWNHAENSALRIVLGSDSHKHVEGLISSRLNRRKKWVLVGGPPCQAYSLVGRSRRANDPEFEKDEKHFLYKEYLKIIIDHGPPVFIMENVKGLLSAKVRGDAVLTRILRDLSKPKVAMGREENGLSYKLYSLSHEGELTRETDPSAFVVKAEEYGVPQARHRMFIVGVRDDLKVSPDKLMKEEAPSVEDIIGNLPVLRSGISRGQDSATQWQRIIKKSQAESWFKVLKSNNQLFDDYSIKNLNGSSVLPVSKSSNSYCPPTKMKDWYYDGFIDRLTLHEARSHMESDIRRYLFASSHAMVFSKSPKLMDFPVELLPQHKNVQAGRKGKMFADRFRVQLQKRVSTTITSHISKDGHYYIHYDPVQSRSLTVREAARLQTFPDNYFFEGPRTSQYHQVGNAVPPFLANQIAEIINHLLDQIPD